MHAVLYMIDGGVAVILNKYISDFYLRFTNEFRGSLGIWVLSFSLSLCPFLCLAGIGGFLVEMLGCTGGRVWLCGRPEGATGPVWGPVWGRSGQSGERWWCARLGARSGGARSRPRDTEPRTEPSEGVHIGRKV